MTNPNQEDAQLTNLSDDYIRDLEPENQRYDITLAQDFVISVLPNGIKTWAFIYDFQGRHRRKTLGVFPEMNFDDAKVALEKARASMLRMDEPTVAPNEFGQLPAVLGGSHYVSKRKKKPLNRSLWIKIISVLLIAAAVAYVVTQRPAWLSSQADETESNSSESNASMPFTVNKTVQTTPETTSPSTNTRQPAPAPSASQPSTVSAAVNATTPAESPAAEPVTDQSALVQTAPAIASSESRPDPTPAATTPSSTTRSEPQPVASQPVYSTPETAPPITTLTTTSKATAFGGRVARSRLTSRVQDLEPIDTLGPEISYKNSGFTRVFYFTELREFGDGNVVHRWSLNGEIKEEVELKVKKSWRWRTYSNKDLTPGLNGEWKVETIDATGKILDTEIFTYDYQ